jgi:hypothetical protein
MTTSGITPSASIALRAATNSELSGQKHFADKY